MKNTFVCDESIMINIPIGRLKDAGHVQVLPEEFRCVYRDTFKVFAYNGKPKPLGATQATAGLFIVALGLIVQTYGFSPFDHFIWIYTIPCLVFVVSGLVSYAAGQGPNMHLAKLSFSLNIISLCWSFIALFLCSVHVTLHRGDLMLYVGIRGVLIVLLIVELLIALFLIYWLSKAVCRDHFNTLPLIVLKQVD